MVERSEPIEDVRRPRRRRVALVALSVGLFALLGFGLVKTRFLTYYRLEFRAEKLPPGPVDVVFVPGLELFDDGKGRPALWNRVLAGKLALDRGAAPLLLVSGGKPKAGITEADRMVECARALGVPAEAILAEPIAYTSVENARFGAEMMVARGRRSALVISDAYHLRYAIPVFRDAFEARRLELYWTPVDAEELARSGRALADDAPPW